MKRLLPLITLLAFFSQINAQITLEYQTHTPQIGDTVKYIFKYEDNGFLKEDGAGVIWDMSGFTGQDTTIIYLDPADSQSPDQYPNASFTQKFMSESFFQADDVAIFDLGLRAPGLLEINYESKKTLFFPISYNDSDEGEYSGEMIFMSSTSQLTGDYEIKADGYGTLILPEHTINDVLRIRAIYNDYGEGGNTDSIYFWYDLHNRNFLLLYHISTGALFPPTTVLLMNPVIAVNSNNELVSDFCIYPNPCKDLLNIEFNHIPSEISIYNSIGQKVFSNYYYQSKTTINVSNLPAGVYIINLKSDSKNSNKRIIIKP